MCSRMASELASLNTQEDKPVRSWTAPNGITLALPSRITNGGPGPKPKDGFAFTSSNCEEQWASLEEKASRNERDR